MYFVCIRLIQVSTLEKSLYVVNSLYSSYLKQLEASCFVQDVPILHLGVQEQSVEISSFVATRRKEGQVGKEEGRERMGATEGRGGRD